jgi:hypothetical protein
VDQGNAFDPAYPVSVTPQEVDILVPGSSSASITVS